MKETTIAVTAFEYDKAPEIFDSAVKYGFRCFRAPKEETALAQAIRDKQARHAILGVERYSGSLYEALPEGGVIARYGVGFDGLDLARATSNGILCVNTPGVLEESVAEHTIALMLAAARCLPALHRTTKNGEWQPRQGTELRGKRLAVIGCGLIGCSVARIASAGFGMDVVGCEVRYIDETLYKREYGFSSIVRDFTSAVDNASYISLHIPSTPATRGFINERRLGIIPSRAWLINTARGAVIDENALYDAIDTGRIGGAALDVYGSEPYTPVDASKDLRTLDRIIMTPHVASGTGEACVRVAERALKNIEFAETGEYESMDLLNPDVLLNN